MDEASQNSFYEDDLLVSGVTSEVKSHLKNQELFTCRSICQQLQEEPIPNELRTDDAPDFTVPDCDDQKCQLEIQHDFKHTTSMSHFLPQEHRAVPSIEMCNEISSMADNLKEPPEEHMHSKDDTGKYGASKDDLYLDWNAQSQSKSELMNKVPSSWPAIGVKSIVTDNDTVTPDQPTLSFFTLAKQARVLSDEQLQKIMELEHSHHSDQHRRSPLKRNSPSRQTFGSPAEKFAKMDLDTDMENYSEDLELFSPEETIDDDSGHVRVNTDQEVPLQEESGNVTEEAVVDEEMHDNAISSFSSFGKTSSLNSEDSILNGHGSNEDHFHIEKAPFYEEPIFTGPCTESFCTKFTKKDHGGDLSSKKIQEKEGSPAYEEDAASSSDAKIQGDEPCLANQLGEISDPPKSLQTVIITNEEISVHGEVHVVPNPLPVIDNIPCKYPPLAQMAPYNTAMCSSLRAIDERDLITECLDDVECSPIKSTKDLYKAEIPSLYQQEVVHNWDEFLPKTSHDLENFSPGCLTTNRDDMASWHAECFDKVQLGKSSNNWVKEQTASLREEGTPSTINHVCLPSEKTVDAVIDVTADTNNCHQQAACEETILESEGISDQEEMKMPTNVSDQENDDKRIVALPDDTNMVFKITTQDDTCLSTGNDDDDNKENSRGTSPGIEDEKKLSESHHEETDQFRTEIQSKMIDLDGPELLQFAMIFVEGALKKSNKTVPGCSEQLKCDEENKNVTRAAPVFPWKRRILYQSQQASLLGSTFDETYPYEAGSNVDEDGGNGDADNQEGSPHLVMPLPKTSCNRPLRLGLSRKHRNKPLHPYLKKHSDAKPN